MLERTSNHFNYVVKDSLPGSGRGSFDTERIPRVWLGGHSRSGLDLLKVVVKPEATFPISVMTRQIGLAAFKSVGGNNGNVRHGCLFRWMVVEGRSS